jgi:hypothetical protein
MIAEGVERSVVNARFPSLEYFQALQRCMRAENERFKRLGYFDTTFGVEVLGTSTQRYVLTFEVFDCTEIRQVRSFDGEGVDFILSGERAAWEEMLDNIRLHGAADAAHSINTLTHFGERLKVIYDDPDGHDKLYRFAESVQSFFDLAAKVDSAGELAQAIA